MSKFYTIFVYLLTFSAFSYGQVANTNLETLVNICDSYENTINDINAEYDIEVTESNSVDISEGTGQFIGPQKFCFIAAKPFDQTYKLTQMLKSKDSKGNILESYWMRAYNGNVFKEYQKTNNSSIASASISNTRNPLKEEYSTITPLGFTIFHRAYGSKPLLDLLKDHSINNRFDYTLSLDANITKVNDFNAIEIACISQKSAVMPDFKKMSLFFSVDHNYTLVKISRYSGPQRVSVSYNVIQLKDLGGGIWFPTKTNITNDLGVIKNILTVSKVAINQKLTEKDFDVEFAPGTRVHDEISGKMYTIKPAQEQLDESLPK